MRPENEKLGSRFTLRVTLYSVSFDFQHTAGPRAFLGPSKGYKRCFTDGYCAQVYPTGGSLLKMGVNNMYGTRVNTYIHGTKLKIEATGCSQSASPELPREDT